MRFVKAAVCRQAHNGQHGKAHAREHRRNGMTKQDKAIWAMLKKRSAVAKMAYSYLTGQFWLNQAMGIFR